MKRPLSMNVGSIRRYIWLIDTISRAGRSGLSFEEINRKWIYNTELSDGEIYAKRSFHRHREDVEELFGVKILCHSHDYRYYIDDSDDIRRPSVSRKWMLESVSLNNMIQESVRVRDRVLLEDIPSAQNQLLALLQAISDNRMADVVYQGFWHKEEKTLKNFETYALKVYQRRWYAVGKSGGDQLKIYSLDRMHDVRLLDTTFKMPEEWSADEYFEHTFGVIVDNDYDVEDILLKVTRFQANFLKTLPLHSSQRIESEDADSVIFGYTLRPTDDFVHKILELADTTEVLQPLWLRNEVVAYLMDTLKKYGKPSKKTKNDKKSH